MIEFVKVGAAMFRPSRGLLRIMSFHGLGQEELRGNEMHRRETLTGIRDLIAYSVMCTDFSRRP